MNSRKQDTSNDIQFRKEQFRSLIYYLGVGEWCRVYREDRNIIISVVYLSLIVLLVKDHAGNIYSGN